MGKHEQRDDNDEQWSSDTLLAERAEDKPAGKHRRTDGSTDPSTS
jgi:hypothetical protein